VKSKGNLTVEAEKSEVLFLSDSRGFRCDPPILFTAALSYARFRIFLPGAAQHLPTEIIVGLSAHAVIYL